MKYGFVYIWRDRKHNRYYIGAHWGKETDKYICSSKWMRNSYKCRPLDFDRRTLFRTDDKEKMWEKEYQWLQLIKENELGKKYYNHFIQKYNLTGKHQISRKTREKMSQAKKGSIPWNKGKKCFYLSELASKRTYSEKTIEKMRMAKLGKLLSEEHKRKISQSNIGKIMKQESIDSSSLKRRGQKRTPEQIKRIKDGIAHSNKGKWKSKI